MQISKYFKDFVFRRCKRSTYGTLHLISPNREPVTVTKEIRYSIARGASTVHINSYPDLVEFCKKAAAKQRMAQSCKPAPSGGGKIFTAFHLGQRRGATRVKTRFQTGYMPQIQTNLGGYNYVNN